MKKFFLDLLGPIDKVDVMEAATLMGGFFAAMALVAVICFNVH